MEINNLDIINIQNIPGNMIADEAQGEVFSQIFTEMIGLIDVGDSSEDLELVDLSELIPDQEEEEQEDILFNPMNVPWISNNNLQAFNLNVNYLESDHEYSISDKVALDINKDLSLENEDSLVGVEEPLIITDESKTIGMDKQVKPEDPQINFNNSKENLKEEALESSLPKSEPKPIEKEINFKDNRLPLASRDNPLRVRNSDEIDLYKTQILAPSGNKIITDEFNNGLNSQLTKLESSDFSDNIQSINDAVVKLVDLKANDGDNTMKVKLYPEELGYVDIILKMEEGKLVAKILVENEQVMELFNKNMDQLNDKLIRQDINLGKIQIDLNLDTSSHSNSHRDQGPNKNPFRNNRDIKIMEDLQTIELSESYFNGANGLNILA